MDLLNARRIRPGEFRRCVGLLDAGARRVRVTAGNADQFRLIRELATCRKP